MLSNMLYDMCHIVELIPCILIARGKDLSDGINFS